MLLIAASDLGEEQRAEVVTGFAKAVIAGPATSSRAWMPGVNRDQTRAATAARTERWARATSSTRARAELSACAARRETSHLPRASRSTSWPADCQAAVSSARVVGSVPMTPTDARSSTAHTSRSTRTTIAATCPPASLAWPRGRIALIKSGAYPCPEQPPQSSTLSKKSRRHPVHAETSSPVTRHTSPAVLHPTCPTDTKRR